jgi:hypothetical protein
MEIEKIIALHRYALHDRRDVYKLALIGHALFLLLFKRYKFEVTKLYGNKGPTYLFFKALHRFDYDKLFSKISSQCKFNKILAEVNVSYGFDFSFLTGIINKMRHFDEIDTESFLDKLYLFISYLFYTKIIKSINKFEFDILVVFADMQPVDNLIVQFYKDKIATTVTLQHGLFVDYEGHYNLSSVSYENVVSNYFLSWGEENKKLILRHNPLVEVSVCGNPTIESHVRVGKAEKKYFTVFFDWDVFKDENIEMINIAYQVSDVLNIKFHLRLHPSNDLSNYDINKQYLVENVDYKDSFFMLGHTSSMIHICQRLGLPAFKYSTDIPSNPVHKKYLFTKSEDILLKIIDIDDYCSEYSHNIGPIGDESLMCYKEFFEGIK